MSGKKHVPLCKIIAFRGWEHANTYFLRKILGHFRITDQKPESDMKLATTQ